MGLSSGFPFLSCKTFGKLTELQIELKRRKIVKQVIKGIGAYLSCILPKANENVPI